IAADRTSSVFVFDENEAWAEALRDVLRFFGFNAEHRVATTEDGADALAALEANRFVALVVGAPVFCLGAVLFDLARKTPPFAVVAVYDACRDVLDLHEGLDGFVDLLFKFERIAAVLDPVFEKIRRARGESLSVS